MKYLLKVSGLFLISIGMMTIGRILFCLFYLDKFGSLKASDIWMGWRFDLSIIAYLTGALYFFILVPVPSTWTKRWLRIALFLFAAFNILFILLNSVDLAYFDFTGRRSGFELLNTMGKGEDGRKLIITYITDFWYVTVIWLVLSLITLWLTRFIGKKIITERNTVRPLILWLASFFIIPVMVIAARGGVQLRPVDIISASEMATPERSAVVLNTPFCVMKTYNRTFLAKKSYFDDKTAAQWFNFCYQPLYRDSFRQKNVIIIIMESFGSEYTAAGSPARSYTPFLDSLSKKSYNFQNAFANGKTSIQGVPSIIAGIPTLFNGAYVYSPYNANSIQSIAGILGKMNYRSSFFHGGSTGTMGFNSFCKAAGFGSYAGRENYNGPAVNDDGQWGVYDHAFFHYYKQSLDTSKSPFVSCFFSLSSHHPYLVPPGFRNKFPKGTLPIHESIGYADDALRMFFKEASASSWYRNTLFVITADHTSLSDHPDFSNSWGQYRIPLLFFDPAEPGFHANSNRVVQQTDIIPGILDCLRYPYPAFCFGNSPFRDDRNEFALQYLPDTYQWITADEIILFDGSNVIKSYKYDKNKSYRDAGREHRREQLNRLKAYIQRYNDVIIKNAMKPCGK